MSKRYNKTLYVFAKLYIIAMEGVESDIIGVLSKKKLFKKLIEEDFIIALMDEGIAPSIAIAFKMLAADKLVTKKITKEKVYDDLQDVILKLMRERVAERVKEMAVKTKDMEKIPNEQA